MDLQGQSWLAANAASVLDAVVDAIITIDAHGIIQSLNSATESMFGYQPESLVGQPVTMLMPEPYKTHHQEYVGRFIASKEPQIIGIGRELIAEKHDGTIFPIYLAVSEIPDGQHFVGIIRDLSDQRHAEQALAEQKERVAQVGRLATMGEMAASIAHEINQPLTAISMYAQASLRLLTKPDHDPEKVLLAIEKLNAQSLRAGDVIERIQRFVHNTSGQKSLNDLSALLNDIHKLAAGDARLHGVNLRLQIDESAPKVYCDAVQVQQVALNLVRNAIDAMFDIDCANGAEIEVRTELKQEQIVVSVIDSGPGVLPADVERIFVPFHSTKPDGMGMGLAICKSIVQEHGGELNFHNNTTVGATFYFSLPIGVPHE